MTDYKKQISTEDREQLEKKTGFTKQTSGSKAIKILARRLRAQRIKHSVYKIRDPSTNKLTLDSETIQTIFKSYYEMLSTPPTHSYVTIIQNYLLKLDLPTVDTNLSQALTSPTSKNELDNAISKLKTHRSPGSDGFPDEWHEVHKQEISSLLFPRRRHLCDSKRRQEQRLL